MGEKEIDVCDKCGSEFLRSKSKMQALCPECASVLYGYPNCRHIFKKGRCVLFLWDGTKSKYIKSSEE